MNKRYCTHLQPLKCNFCTQWFSVTQTFANLQRYCFNICPSCYSNFQFKIVHPKTYQVHQLRLIPTSLYLGDSKTMLTEKFTNLLASHRAKSNLSEENEKLINNIANQEMKVVEEVQNFIENMQQKLDGLYKSIFNKILQSWNSVTDKTQKAIKMFTTYKHEQVNKLADRTYNFKQDNSQIFSVQKYKAHLSYLQMAFRQTKQLNEGKFIEQLQKVLSQFLRSNNMKVMNQRSILATPNLKNLKGLRQKLVDKSNISSRKILIDNIDTKPRLNSKASFKKIGLGKQNSLNHNTSQKSLKNLSSNREKSQNQKYKLREPKISTPRAFYDEQPIIKLDFFENRPNQIDVYREEINKIMKDKELEQFQSYLPLNYVKQQSKILGQKQKLQHIIDLKIKTVKTQKIWELINEKLNSINIAHYLKAIDKIQTVEIIRFVKVSLNDTDFDTLLNFIKDKPCIHTLVLTNNKLTQSSIHAVINFMRRNPSSNIKNIYMGNNRIQPVKIKPIIQKIKQLKINLHA